MTKIHIEKWEGRVGNNLGQLGRALHLAKCVGAEVSLPDASLCDTMQKELFLYTDSPSRTSWFGLSMRAPKKKLPFKFTCKREFYDIQISLPPVFSSKFNSDDRLYSDLLAHSSVHKSQYSPRMRNIFIQHIKPHLERNIFKNVKNTVIDDHTLTIHLRAGDVMDPKTTHPSFPQAPLSFFTKVLSSGVFKNVIICTEYSRFTNPVLRPLVTYCQNRNIACDSKPRTVAEDMYIIANSKNLAISGYTSFSRMLVLCAEEIRNIFVPRINRFNEPETMVTSFYNNKSVRVESYIFPDYFSSGSEWSASDDQKRRMMSYPEEKVLLNNIT